MLIYLAFLYSVVEQTIRKKEAIPVTQQTVRVSRDKAESACTHRKQSFKKKKRASLNTARHKNIYVFADKPNRCYCYCPFLFFFPRQLSLYSLPSYLSYCFFFFFSLSFFLSSHCDHTPLFSERKKQLRWHSKQRKRNGTRLNQHIHTASRVLKKKKTKRATTPPEPKKKKEKKLQKKKKARVCIYM